MDKIIKKYCPTCADYKDCPYRLRNLESKCSELSDVAYGYELAEQELALTWEDIKMIFTIADNYDSEFERPHIGSDAYYKEVLRRFLEQREK